MTPSWPMFHGALALGALAVITLTADQALMAEVGPAPARSTELAEPIAPIPTSRAWDPRRVALGQRLFHEVRLSRDGARSCATCHPLDRGADPDYVSGFRAAYRGGLTRPNVLDALAAFERSLETPDARFDQYLRGERDALTESERRGYTLFKEYGCATCHQGINVGGNMFQKFGIFPDRSGQSPELDLGRYHVTRASRDRGVFRVPSLRNVAVTAPYFHDGRAESLEAAVDTMANVQLGRMLRPEEIALIVQFLHTLTGRYRGQLLGPAPPAEW